MLRDDLGGGVGEGGLEARGSATYSRVTMLYGKKLTTL